MSAEKPAVRLRAIGPSPRTRHAVLKAASELLGSKAGYAAVTVEKIAERAQVAKTTNARKQKAKLIPVLSADAVLFVLVRPQANIGQLLFELRRNREHIAALV